MLGLVDVPGSVGIHTDASLRPHRLAHGSHASDVVRQCLAGLCDLDLRRAAPGEPGQHVGDP